MEIKEVENFKFEKLGTQATNVSMRVLITNHSNHKLIVKDYELKIIANNRYIGKLKLNDSFIILPDTSEWYSISMQLKLMDILSALSLYNSYLNGEKIIVNLHGSFVVKVFLFSKKGFFSKEIVLKGKEVSSM